MFHSNESSIYSLPSWFASSAMICIYESRDEPEKAAGKSTGTLDPVLAGSLPVALRFRASLTREDSIGRVRG